MNKASIILRNTQLNHLGFIQSNRKGGGSAMAKGIKLLKSKLYPYEQSYKDYSYMIDGQSVNYKQASEELLKRNHIRYIEYSNGNAWFKIYK